MTHVKQHGEIDGTLVVEDEVLWEGLGNEHLFSEVGDIPGSNISIRILLFQTQGLVYRPSVPV